VPQICAIHMQILFIMGAKLLFKYRGRCEASDINQRTMGLTELLVIGVIAVGGVFGRLNCRSVHWNYSYLQAC